MKALRKKLVRDLLSGKWLFIAVVMVIFLGVAMYGSSYMAYENLKKSYDYSYDKLHFADFTVKVTAAPPNIAAELEKIPGVSAVTSRINTDIGVSLPGETGYGLIATAISVPPDQQPAVDGLKLESGNYLTTDDKYGLLVEKSFADYHKLKPGDTILLTGKSGETEFHVSGIVASPEYIFPAKSRNEFFVSEATWGVIFFSNDVAAELTDANNVNQFCVLINKDADLNTVIGQFEEKLAPYNVGEVITKDEQPSNAGLKLDLQEFSEVAEVFPLLFLFVGALTTFILISRIIERQRGQLGLMRALGYSRRQVLLHYLGFALFIGVTGAVTGIIAGYFLSESVTNLYITMLGLPYKIISVHWTATGEGIFIGILPSLIAGIFPAYSASRLRPAEVMRTPPPSAGRRPLLEKMFSFLKKMSLLWKVPFRNIFRNRRRSIATILGVIFGTVLIMVSAGFLDSIDNLFQLQFDKIQAYDARIAFAGPMPESTAGSLVGADGIKEAVPVLRMPVEYIHGEKTYTTLVVGITPGTGLYNFYSHGGDRLNLKAGSILLTGAVKNQLDVKIGDTVTVKTASGTTDFTVNGLVDQPMGSYGYITLPDAQKLAGGQAVITSVLLSVDKASIPSLRNTIANKLGAVGVEITSEMRAQMAKLMDLINVMMWVMLAFGAILALMVVFTMISVSLIERRREIATMRTLGERSGRIAAMVTIENLMLGVVGLILGIPAGYGVTLYFMKLVQTDMFSFDLVFYLRTYLLTAGIIIIVMLLSQLPGILGLNKLDLAKVTKEQVS